MTVAFRSHGIAIVATLPNKRPDKKRGDEKKTKPRKEGRPVRQIWLLLTAVR